MNNVKKFRCKIGLSQLELANKLGLHRTYITALESPNCERISNDLARRMAEVFGCSVFEVHGTNVFHEAPKTDEDKILLIKMLAKDLDDKTKAEQILEVVKQL